MLITEELLNNLSQQAKESPRLRVAYDLRTTPNDHSQRILNAMEPRTVLPIHRHMKSSESMAVLRGAVRQYFFNENGELTEVYDLKAGSNLAFVQIPLGAWHKAECLEPGTIIFESKDGAYEPLAPEDILNVEIVNKKTI